MAAIKDHMDDPLFVEIGGRCMGFIKERREQDIDWFTPTSGSGPIVINNHIFITTNLLCAKGVDRAIGVC